jgi:hypothetical protein
LVLVFGDGRPARALAQGGFRVGGPPVLPQQVSEFLVGKLLEVLHPVARQKIECQVSSSNWTRLPGMGASLGQPLEPTAVAAGGSANSWRHPLSATVWWSTAFGLP